VATIISSWRCCKVNLFLTQLQPVFWRKKMDSATTRKTLHSFTKWTHSDVAASKFPNSKISWSLLPQMHAASIAWCWPESLLTTQDPLCVGMNAFHPPTRSWTD